MKQKRKDSQMSKQSCMLLDIARREFIHGAKVVGAATLNDMASDADAILCF